MGLRLLGTSISGNFQERSVSSVPAFTGSIALAECHESCHTSATRLLLVVRALSQRLPRCPIGAAGRTSLVRAQSRAFPLCLPPDSFTSSSART